MFKDQNNTYNEDNISKSNYMEKIDINSVGLSKEMLDCKKIANCFTQPKNTPLRMTVNN